MNHIYSTLFLFLSILPIIGLSQQGYLKADGKKIVDTQGKELILRGMGMGGWMLQEGYMLENGDFAGPQHKIRTIIEDVIGPENTKEFYDAWLANYCTRADIDSMKAWGFNSIRLPMHYNLYTLPIEKEPITGQDTWLEKGFTLTDSLLKWCTANEMYIILDLHAAPGGQGKDANISDYDSTKPSLWESTENKRKTIALWKKLAEHYANESWIGGYDLLNEPNWDIDNAGNTNGCSCNQNTALWNLYKEIITAIRQVDNNHMVIIEGNCWGNNYNGIPNAKSMDNNIALSFHKYWNYNDQGSVQGIINLRNTHNVPLWLGESGENSNNWFTNAIELAESNQIGWAWWPYKKIGSVAGTVTIPKTSEYQSLLNYWKGNSNKPSIDQAKTTLMDVTEKMKLENSIIHYDVIDAMFRQIADKTSKPFKKNEIPGRIFASDYDLGRSGVAYFDNDSANYNVTTQVYTAWNQGWAYRNDGVDIQACTNESTTNGYNIGWTNEGEWMLYTIDVLEDGAYQCDVRYATTSPSAKISISIDGLKRTESVALPSTGGWDKWATLQIKDIPIKTGMHKIKIRIDKTGFNLNYVQFGNPVSLESITPRIIDAFTVDQGTSIELNSTFEISPTILPASSDFKITVNGQGAKISSISLDENSPYLLKIKLEQTVYKDDLVLISYTGNSMKSILNTTHTTFSNMSVINNAHAISVIPATIQAETYETNNGWELETCTDSNGGLNLSYSNSGDYTTYRIKVPKSGNYQFNYRVSSNNSAGGKFSLSLKNGEQLTELHEVDINSTGGWQSWKTISATAYLEAGDHIIQFSVVKPEFNLNWISIDFITSINQLGTRANGPSIRYNGQSKELIFENLKINSSPIHISISDISGRIIKKLTIDKTTETSYIWKTDFKTEGLNLVTISNTQFKQTRKILF